MARIDAADPRYKALLAAAARLSDACGAAEFVPPGQVALYFDTGGVQFALTVSVADAASLGPVAAGLARRCLPPGRVRVSRESADAAGAAAVTGHEYMTAAEVAILLRVSLQTVIKMASKKNPDFRSVRIGSSTRIERASLEAFLAPRSHS